MMPGSVSSSQTYLFSSKLQAAGVGVSVGQVLGGAAPPPPPPPAAAQGKPGDPDHGGGQGGGQGGQAPTR